MQIKLQLKANILDMRLILKYESRISLEKGKIITEKDLICLRPCEGISAIDYDQILGKELLVSVDKFQVLEWGMFK